MMKTNDNKVIHCDLLVIGSGCSGLGAAVTAAWHGLNVIVVEKDSVFGGATAWSGGWMWVPGNPLAQRAGIHEDPNQPRIYLRNQLGDRYNEKLVDAFLDHGPNMVSFFETHTELQFVDGNAIPDMRGNVPGAATGGHQVIAAPYDGREIGALIQRLRKTMRETSFMGMPIMAGSDLMAFLTLTRSFKSFVHVAKRVSRHILDLAFYGRAMQLVNGVALIGRLAKSAENLGVQMMASTPAKSLISENGIVKGAVVGGVHGDIQIYAQKGVILAAGGFPHDIERRKKLFPRTPTGQEHLALSPESCSGDGITLGESVGGSLARNLASPVAWAPVSKVVHSDGKVGHFPHIIERGKPGLIAVLSNGKRFVNEAEGYYDYTAAMVAASPQEEEVASWLICDHRFQRLYGLGYARPFPLPTGSLIRRGYLKKASTLEALAQQCGIDPKALVETVTAYNLHAKDGRDPEFGRGSTPFNQKQGDPFHQGPNPCVAPIQDGPFYAVKVQAGSFGTFSGLRTNEHAQVLDQQDQAIPGLYAVGTDMASVMGGYYPSGGVNLGPAMTFAYIAGRHAVGVDNAHDKSGVSY